MRHLYQKLDIEISLSLKEEISHTAHTPMPTNAFEMKFEMVPIDFSRQYNRCNSLSKKA